MKLIYIMFLLYNITIFGNAEQSKPDLIIVKVDNESHNETNVTQSLTASYDCLCNKFFGAKLKKCMSCLEPNLWTKNFANLAPHQQKNYIATLTIEQHAKLFSQLKQEDWQEIHARCDAEVQKVMPQQLQMFNDLINQANKKGRNEFYRSVAAGALFVCLVPSLPTYAIYGVTCIFFNVKKAADEAFIKSKKELLKIS